MKIAVMGAAALALLPFAVQAQSAQNQGFYIGAEGGLNWMFNTTANVPGFGGAVNIYPATGWAAGGMIGYDFGGPRVELEGIYRSNQATLQAAPVGFQQFTAGANINQTAIMANIMYDFRFGSPIVPYIGAGAGIAFVNASALNGSTSSTQFAYQGIIGVGYEIDPNWRINIDGRYYGTTNPTINNPLIGGVTYNNNNITLMASVQFKFGAPAAAAPPPPPPAVAPPSFMVFFDWVATPCQRRQGRLGARWRAGPGDHCHRRGREGPAGTHRRWRARAAEPPRRDRHSVGLHIIARRRRPAGPLFLRALRMAGEVVQDHHVALLQRRSELGLDIGVEDLAVHGLVASPLAGSAVIVSASASTPRASRIVLNVGWGFAEAVADWLASTP